MRDRKEVKRLSQSRILVVGDVMLDKYWFGSAKRISPEAPVPIVAVEREEFRIGGAGNVASNAASLGLQVGLVALVGSDPAADTLSNWLESANIENHLVIDANISTTIKTRLIAQQQQLIRIDFEADPSVGAATKILERFENIKNKYDAVILSDYGKGGLRNVANIIAHCKDAGIPVFVDPKGLDFSKYKNADYLTPNKKELEAVTGSWESEAELDEKASALRNELGLQGLLVTRSEEGMTLYCESGKIHFPTRAKEVFDVSGAGDTVIAVFGALVSAGFSLEEASSLANKAAGVVVGKVGTATVTFDELFSDGVSQ